jgi:hypothetical protein
VLDINPEYYDKVQQALELREVPGVTLERVSHAEGGVLS